MSWDELARLARRHRVESLLFAGAMTHRLDLPDEFGAELKKAAQATAAANLMAAAECGRLCKRFATAGLPLLFFKGLTLSQLAHGTANLKFSRDIDLLVRPADVEDAGRLLGELGYSLEEPKRVSQLARWHRWSKESVWLHPAGLMVELHSRLTDNPALLRDLGADGPAQLVGVAPGIALPTLEDKPLLAYLAVHGASSAWFRLKWLSDLQGLLRGGGTGELDEVHAAMRTHGAGRAADLAMLLMQEVYELPLSPGLSAELRQSSRVRWLLGEALRQLCNPTEPTARRGGTAGIHLSQLLLGDHWAFPVSEGVRRTGEVLFRRFSAG